MEICSYLPSWKITAALSGTALALEVAFFIKLTHHANGLAKLGEDPIWEKNCFQCKILKNESLVGPLICSALFFLIVCVDALRKGVYNWRNTIPLNRPSAYGGI